MSNSKKKVTDGKTVLVRIIAIILAILLLSSGIAMIIEMILPASADEPRQTESYAFASSLSNREFYVAVALRWGTSVTVSHEITSPYGFAVGEARITRTERSFTPVWQLSENDVIAAADCNLTVGYRTCSVALSDAETDIGCYHVELRLAQTEPVSAPDEPETTEEPEVEAGEPEPESTEPSETLPEETGSEETTAEPVVTEPEGQIPEEPAEREIWDYLDDMAAMFGITFEQVFPAYIMGEKVIRIGAFANYANATSAAAAIGAELEGFEVSVASPAFNGLCILNEDYDTILFKYAGEEYCDGAICALQNPDSSSASYLCFTGNGRLYDGAFCFRRYVSASNDADGLVLINLVELLSYCEGVIAGEVYNTWPKETLKAFAVTVNSFTTRNRNRRFEKYGCDLVASGEDQNYVGRSNVNANVENACREAYGKIRIGKNFAVCLAAGVLDVRVDVAPADVVLV